MRLRGASWQGESAALAGSVRSCRFFELPTYADTATSSAKKPCFLLDLFRTLDASQSSVGRKQSGSQKFRAC